MAKFFRLTLTGDKLDLDKVNTFIDLPCIVYHKNDVVTKIINGKEYFLKQKTNRLVFKNECPDNKRIDGFLSENLKMIYSKINEVKSYLHDIDILLELIIYTEGKAKISINKRQAELINKIGAKIDIIFP